MYLLISYYLLQNSLFSLLTVLNRTWRSCYELLFKVTAMISQIQQTYTS